MEGRGDAVINHPKIGPERSGGVADVADTPDDPIVAGGGAASAGNIGSGSCRHITFPEEMEPTKALDKVAPREFAIGPLRVIMKIFFGATFARPDLIRACKHLALYVTKWDKRCDQKLHRLVCYINSTLDWRHIGWVGDCAADLYPYLFADADFAGCAQTSRSTSESFLCFRGPTTFFPVAMHSKRQGCVSHSTPEAEIVVADFAMRAMGLPILDLTEATFRRTPVLFLS